MTVVVADSSVVIKWLLPQRGEEQAARAVHLWEGFRNGRLQLIQPPHWLAEVAAVVARLSPATAAEDIRDLHELGIIVTQSSEVYTTACELSISLNHHLFDTLYYAVALSLADATLVTADDRYYRKAHARGQITRLADFDAATM